MIVKVMVNAVLANWDHWELKPMVVFKCVDSMEKSDIISTRIFNHGHDMLGNQQNKMKPTHKSWKSGSADRCALYLLHAAFKQNTASTATASCAVIQSMSTVNTC